MINLITAIEITNLKTWLLPPQTLPDWGDHQND